MKIVLRKRLEKALRSGHPWVFRDALEGRLPEPGTIVTILDRRGRFVARGLSESGPIGVRVFCTRDEPLDQHLIQRRLQVCAELRRHILPRQTSAYRLVHGEGDRLPGVVCDVYGAYAVLKLDGQAAKKWQPIIVESLRPGLSKLGVLHLLLKSDRKDAGGVQALIGRLPSGPVSILEHGVSQKVDLMAGQKTGLFLDHRESRRRVRDLARNLRVLNLYGYTGGFSVSAGLGGAVWVDTVDRSAGALELARQNWIDNGLDPQAQRCLVTPVEDFFQSGSKLESPYGLIVSDPPSFAPSERALDAARRAYRRLHQSALDILAPDGLYLAASCSSHMDRKSFEQTIWEAARNTGKVVQVLERWGAPADHPKLAVFPEGDYLKVVLARLVG